MPQILVKSRCIWGDRSFYVCSLGWPISVGQSLSALCTSSLENVSAVSSLHSLTEAMLLFSLTLLRLVGSEHFCFLLVRWSLRKRDSRGCISLLYNDNLYYIQTNVLCQVFYEIFTAFFSFFLILAVLNVKNGQFADKNGASAQQFLRIGAKSYKLCIDTRGKDMLQ